MPRKPARWKQSKPEKLVKGSRAKPPKKSAAKKKSEAEQLSLPLALPQ